MIFRCEPLDRTSPEGNRMAVLSWWYFLYNFTQFFDVILFMLLNRYNKVARYLTFHHNALSIGCWLIVKFSPGGHAIFFALINSISHVITFGYLTLKFAFPEIRKFCMWWPKFLKLLVVSKIFFFFLFYLIFVHFRHSD